MWCPTGANLKVVHAMCFSTQRMTGQLKRRWLCGFATRANLVAGRKPPLHIWKLEELGLDRIGGGTTRLRIECGMKLRCIPSSALVVAVCIPLKIKMANQYGLSIWSKVFLCSAILFVGSEAKTSISAIDLGADGHNANSTYFDNWQDQFVIDPLAAITTQIDPGSLRQGNFGNRPHKRQNCQGSGSTSQNRCFAGNTAANAYCACSNRCCTNTAKSTGWCCSATVDCDVAALGCKWITYVYTMSLIFSS
jgi:hypothetical protein